MIVDHSEDILCKALPFPEQVVPLAYIVAAHACKKATNLLYLAVVDALLCISPATPEHDLIFIYFREKTK